MHSNTKSLLFLFNLTFFCLVTNLLSSCYSIRGSNGGGQIKNTSPRSINTKDIALPAGYKIEAIVTGLTFPSAITFDDKGQAFVLEAGYSYGEVWTEPKLLRIEPNGGTTQLASGGKNGPWNGITFHEGQFYIAEGGELEGGKIIRISQDGKITALIEGLPSYGDHHTNGPVVKDGYIYFGQGTATNSGVVGKDNYEFGWLKRKQSFHDIPCQDIVLAGKNYQSENMLTDKATDIATTGAYLPFNSPSTAGQVIQGSLPCNGAILRIPVAGGPVELVAWGLRNPFGMAYSPENELYITENSYDERGSRPVWGSGDVLWEIKQGTWYGWPDFAEGKLLSEHEEFKVPGEGKPETLLSKQPNEPPKPAAILGVHSSSNGLDFSTSSAFGFTGEAFIAQFGDMAPGVGKVLSPVGYKVIRVNISNGVVTDFAVNEGKKNGPASWLKKGGLERPVDAQFDPSGNALYIVDFGIMRQTKKDSKPVKGTGVVWKITKEVQ